jgi:hypothetical protein
MHRLVEYFRGEKHKKKLLVSNKRHNSTQKTIVKPKKLNFNNAQFFGERMAVHRNTTGYSQRDLARETGISQIKQKIQSG